MTIPPSEDVQRTPTPPLRLGATSSTTPPEALTKNRRESVVTTMPFKHFVSCLQCVPQDDESQSLSDFLTSQPQAVPPKTTFFGKLKKIFSSSAALPSKAANLSVENLTKDRALSGSSAFPSSANNLEDFKKNLKSYDSTKIYEQAFGHSSVEELTKDRVLNRESKTLAITIHSSGETITINPKQQAARDLPNVRHLFINGVNICEGIEDKQLLNHMYKELFEKVCDRDVEKLKELETLISQGTLGFLTKKADEFTMPRSEEMRIMPGQFEDDPEGDYISTYQDGGYEIRINTNEKNIEIEVSCKFKTGQARHSKPVHLVLATFEANTKIILSKENSTKSSIAHFLGNLKKLT